MARARTVPSPPNIVIYSLPRRKKRFSWSVTQYGHLSRPYLPNLFSFKLPQSLEEESIGLLSLSLSCSFYEHLWRPYWPTSSLKRLLTPNRRASYWSVVSLAFSLYGHLWRPYSLRLRIKYTGHVTHPNTRIFGGCNCFCAFFQSAKTMSRSKFWPSQHISSPNTLPTPFYLYDCDNFQVSREVDVEVSQISRSS